VCIKGLFTGLIQGSKKIFNMIQLADDLPDPLDIRQVMKGTCPEEKSGLEKEKEYQGKLLFSSSGSICTLASYNTAMIRYDCLPYSSNYSGSSVVLSYSLYPFPFYFVI